MGGDAIKLGKIAPRRQRVIQLHMVAGQRVLHIGHGLFPVCVLVVLFDDLGKTAGKAFVGLGFLLQHLPRKDHVLLVAFQHVGHLVIGSSADRSHGGLRLLVGFHADFVDAVGHVLLLGGF